MSFEQTNWWKYMDGAMQDLVKESYLLLGREEKNGDKLHDYSFIVFPMAKAYEGFLKKMFFDLKLISKQQYLGDRFRIGKSLNPHLPKRYAWDWVFGRLIQLCGGEILPLRLWEMWKRGRNQIFHFFPDHHEFIALSRAKELVEEMGNVMGDALSGCKV